MPRVMLLVISWRKKLLDELRRWRSMVAAAIEELRAGHDAMTNSVSATTPSRCSMVRPSHDAGVPTAASTPSAASSSPSATPLVADPVVAAPLVQVEAQQCRAHEVFEEMPLGVEPSSATSPTTSAARRPFDAVPRPQLRRTDYFVHHSGDADRTFG